jgi:hypothetical protein
VAEVCYDVVPLVVVERDADDEVVERGNRVETSQEPMHFPAKADLIGPFGEEGSVKISLHEVVGVHGNEASHGEGWPAVQYAEEGLYGGCAFLMLDPFGEA